MTQVYAKYGIGLFASGPTGTTIFDVSGLTAVQMDESVFYSVKNLQTYENLKIKSHEKNGRDLCVILENGDVIIIADFYLNSIPDDFTSLSEFDRISTDEVATKIPRSFSQSILANNEFDQELSIEAYKEGQREVTTNPLGYSSYKEQIDVVKDDGFNWGQFSIGATAGALGAVLLSKILNAKTSAFDNLLHDYLKDTLQDDNRSEPQNNKTELTQLETAIETLTETVNTGFENIKGDDTENNQTELTQLKTAIETLTAAVNTGFENIKGDDSENNQTELTQLETAIETLTEAVNTGFETIKGDVSEAQTEQAGSSNITINNYNNTTTTDDNTQSNSSNDYNPETPTIAAGENKFLITGEPSNTVRIYNQVEDITDRFTVTENNGIYTAIPKSGFFDGSNIFDIRVTLTNSSQLVSKFSNTISLSFDTTPLETPTLSVLEDDGSFLISNLETGTQPKLLTLDDQEDNLLDSFELTTVNQNTIKLMPKAGAFHQFSSSFFVNTADDYGNLSNNSNTVVRTLHNPLTISAITLDATQNSLLDSTLVDGETLTFTLEYDGAISLVGNDFENFYVTLNNGGVANYVSHDQTSISFAYTPAINDQQRPSGLNVNSFGGDTTIQVLSSEFSTPTSTTINPSLNELLNLDLGVDIRPYIISVGTNLTIDDTRDEIIIDDIPFAPVSGVITLSLSEVVSVTPFQEQSNLSLYVREIVGNDMLTPYTTIDQSNIVQPSDALTFNLTNNAYIEKALILNGEINLNSIEVTGMIDDGFNISDSGGYSISSPAGTYDVVPDPAAGTFITPLALVLEADDGYVLQIDDSDQFINFNQFPDFDDSKFLLRYSDQNGDLPDYVDEFTGLPVSLSENGNATELRVLFDYNYVEANGTPIATPITELVVRVYHELSKNDPSAELSAVSRKIAEFFHLPNVLTTEIVPITDPDFENGTASDYAIALSIMSLFDSVSGSVGATLDAITPLFMETEPDNHEIAQLSNLLTMSYELMDQSSNPVFIKQSERISELLDSLILNVTNIQSIPDETTVPDDQKEDIFWESDGDEVILIIEDYEYKDSDGLPEIKTTNLNLTPNKVNSDTVLTVEQTHVEGAFG